MVNPEKQARIDALTGKRHAAISAVCDGTTTDFGLAGRSLFAVLPEQMATVSDGVTGGGDIETFARQLNRSPMTADVLADGLRILAGADAEQRSLFIDTMPELLSMSSLKLAENNAAAFRQAIIEYAHGIANRRLKFMTPLCPPYNYQSDENGLLKHADGQIHPTIGPRFEKVLVPVSKMLGKLTEAGVEVDFTFCTYSGETGDMADLVELGPDTIGYYCNNPQLLFENLGTAYAELQTVSADRLGAVDVRTETISLDGVFGSSIKTVSGHFQEAFWDVVAAPHVLFGMHRGELVKYLETIPGLTAELLEFYYTEENKYRLGHQHILPDTMQPAILTALQQASLYIQMLHLAQAHGSIVWNMENASSYMLQTLNKGEFADPNNLDRQSSKPRKPYYQKPVYNPPVLMAKPYNPLTPDDLYAIRQPFNPPVMVNR